MANPSAPACGSNLYASKSPKIREATNSAVATSIPRANCEESTAIYCAWQLLFRCRQLAAAGLVKIDRNIVIFLCVGGRNFHCGWSSSYTGRLCRRTGSSPERGPLRDIKKKGAGAGPGARGSYKDAYEHIDAQKCAWDHVGTLEPPQTSTSFFTFFPLLPPHVFLLFYVGAIKCRPMPPARAPPRILYKN